MYGIPRIPYQLQSSSSGSLALMSFKLCLVLCFFRLCHPHAKVVALCSEFLHFLGIVSQVGLDVI